MESQLDIGRVQECLDAAAHCELRAESAIDPAAKATFAEAARCWHELAPCWRELQKQPARGAALVDFTSKSSERQAARMAPKKYGSRR
jgi:hypothetical protein